MAGIFWVLTLLFVTVGTTLTRRRLRRRLASVPLHYEGISLLKPLKGEDAGLEANLESFFRLEYPQFEILFSVAEESDPAVEVVRRLRRKYPLVKARLLVGAEEAGANPKVNNLTRSYRLASFDVVLISDSNVRVAPDYLTKKISHLKPGVGVVTAVVAGLAPSGLGGALEATYLNTFYARGMNLAFATGNPCVVGKSMMFRRSVTRSFGGLRALADFLAEDYALGEEMRKLGLRVVMMNEAVEQFLGAYSFRTFWDRHLRWGRIRKAHAPLAFVIEPFFSPFASSLYAAWALSWWPAFLLNLGFWAACDLSLMQKLSRRHYAWAPFAWFLREALSLPLWIAVASGNTVRWRGHTLSLSYGGKIRLGGEAWTHSYGEPLPARTRLKDTISTAIGGSGRPRAILREG